MTKIGFEKTNPNDTHSINISVYKPDGISSFWNWFTRKNKNKNLSDGVFDKNYKLKLNLDDLNALKKNGIDILKHQNCSKSNNKKSNYGNNNVFMIPKHQLGLKEKEFFNDFIVPNLKKKKTSFGLNSSKIYKNRVMSTSTISIKSKQSIVCPDLKYVQSIKSQRSIVNSIVSSKASFKVGMKSNTNIHGQTKPLNRSVLLKSVPTAILKSNTQKNKVFIPMYLGKIKTDKVNKFQQMKSQENCTNQQRVKDDASSVIPLLLTKIKSMEEQLSDIESTTKKINEVVSQKNILNREFSSNVINIPELNLQAVNKSIASHKIYSKNVRPSRKSKQTPTKKLKNKNKYTITSVNNYKDNSQKHDLNFKNDEHTGIRSTTDKGNYTNVSSPEDFIKHHHFSLPNNIYNKGLFPANPDVGSDIFLGLFNALTKNHGSENPEQNLHTENEGRKQCLKNDSNVRNTKTSGLMSKPTFEWRHKSFSSVSDSQMVDRSTTKFKEESDTFKLQKINSSPYENHTLAKCSPTGHRLITGNKLTNTYLPGNIIFEHIEKEMHYLPCSLTKKDVEKTELLDKTATVKKEVETDLNKEPHYNEERQTINVENDICRSKHEERIRNYNENETEIDLCPNQLPVLKCDVIPEKGLGLRQSDENNLVTSTTSLHANDETNTFDKKLKSSAEESFMQLCNDLPAISVQSGEICSVSIKQSKISGFIKPSENLLKRTKLYSSDTEKEPKLSIMILVEDHLKDEVKISNNIITNLEKSIVEFGQTCSKGFHPVSTNLQSHGNKKHNDVSIHNISGKYSLDYFNSTSHQTPNKVTELTSNYAFKNNSRPSKKRNFWCEVNTTEQTAMTVGENLPFIGQGGYLNQEKRKAYEEQLLRVNAKKSEITTNLNSTPFAKSCTYVKNIGKSTKHSSESALIGREAISNKSNNKKKNQFSFKILQEPDKICRQTSINSSARDYFDAGDKNMFTKWNTPKSYFNNLAEIKRLHETGPNEEIKNKEKEQQIFPKSKIISLNNFIDNNINFYPKGRTHRNSLTLNEEPIFEESEDEMSFQKTNVSDQQKGIGDNIKIQTKHDDTSPRLNKMEDEDSKKGFSCAFNEDNVSMSRCLPVLNSLQSSVSVQTDWSLIGLSVDQFHSNCNEEQSFGSKKTISSQGEVKIKNVALFEKDKNEIPVFCESSMNKSQIKEMVPVVDNSNTKGMDCSQGIERCCHDPLTIDLIEENVTEVKMSGVLIAVIQDKDKNAVETISHENTVKYELDNIMKTNFQKLIEEPAQLLQNSEREIILDVSTNAQINKEGHLLSNTLDTFHYCSIPCFPSMSEENIFSDFPESKLTTLQSSKILNENDSAISQTHKIKNGSMTYYSNKLDKFCNMSRLNTTEEQNGIKRPNHFCRIILDPRDHKLQEPTSDITPQPNLSFNESCVNTKDPNKDTPEPYHIVTQNNNLSDNDGIYFAKSAYAEDIPNKTDTVRTIITAEGNTTMKSHCSVCNKKADSSIVSQKQKVSRDSIVNYVYSIEYDSVQKRGNSCFTYK